jgi:hypothetical protein
MYATDLMSTSANAKKLGMVAAAWLVGVTVWAAGMACLALFF